MGEVRLGQLHYGRGQVRTVTLWERSGLDSRTMGEVRLGQSYYGRGQVRTVSIWERSG
jgi:hypothetical protein